MALKHNLKSGKWIFYVDWERADEVWGKLVSAIRNGTFPPECKVTSAKIYAWTDPETNPHNQVIIDGSLVGLQKSQYFT